MKIIILTENRESDNKWPYPAFYTKADSTLLKCNKPFFVPDFTQECFASFHIVTRLGKLGKSIPQRFAGRYIDAWTLGVLFYPKDIVAEISESVNFDGSTVIGEFMETIPMSAVPIISVTPGQYHYEEPCPGDILDSVGKSLSALSPLFTWRQGDLLFSLPMGPAIRVEEGMHICARWSDHPLLDFNIK